MLLIFVQTALVLSALWTSWQFIRRFVVKTDLDNIPGPPSTSFLTGNFGQLFNINGWEFHREIGEKFGNVILLKGLFGANQLYVTDSKALHHILVKDQNIFEESDSFFATNHLVFGEGLIACHGEQHRKQRKMLNPVFSINHLRHMVPIFYEIANKLHASIGTYVADSPREVDVLQWMTRAALEMIGQSGLGFSFDSLVEGHAEHPYSKSIKELLPTMFTMRFARVLLLTTLVKLGPPKFRRVMVELLPFKNVQKLKNMVDIMEKTSVDILEGKKNALQRGESAMMEQVGQGKDIMSILKVQEKLRRELQEAREQYGEIPHDELVALPYLDAICRETLRLYGIPDLTLYII
ncbi:hypothetical protein H0H81_000768 [Sphagnurus paluster]|uniref:Cytochrome P450 n=1 Tax=Sphagnurus paluster TaxID=117069 RepID=A0A9P7KI29_9AGAR|nr:hypothetical protein H0H81_000768 [Sphagnurus paluster]